MNIIYAASLVLAVAFYAGLLFGVLWLFRFATSPGSSGSSRPTMFTIRRTGAVLVAAILATAATFGPASCSSRDLVVREAASSPSSSGERAARTEREIVRQIREQSK